MYVCGIYDCGRHALIQDTSLELGCKFDGHGQVQGNNCFKIECVRSVSEEDEPIMEFWLNIRIEYLNI